MIKGLYENIKVFDYMSDSDMFEWVWKLYQNMMQVTGIRGRHNQKMTSDDSSYLLSGNES